MKNIILFLIRSYQKNHPFSRIFLASRCRFYPTCSEYTYQAIVRYGTIKGLFLGLKRVLQCNPLFAQRYDPVK